MEPVYVVLIINLIVWSGIFGYLIVTDRKVNALKKKMSALNESKQEME